MLIHGVRVLRLWCLLPMFAMDMWYYCVYLAYSTSG